MNRLRFLLFSLTVICALCSCEEKAGSNSSLTVNPDTLRFTVEGGSQTFEVNSNTDWSITTEEPNIIIQPRTGSAGKTIVRVTIAPTTNTIMTFCTLVVQTNDGSVVRNVRVEQEGQLVTEDVLMVSNHSNYILFAGNAGDADSLMIRSSVAWDIYGPEWIEVLTTGGQFTALSPTVPIRGTGTLTLPIRTSTENKEEYDREGTIILQQSLTGNLQQKLVVQQLGWHRVAPNTLVPLNTTLATDFKCGAGVTSFICHLDSTDHMNTANNNYQEWATMEPDGLCSWSNLTPGAVYYIGTIGLDAGGGFYSVHDMAFQTRNDTNPALALVNNLQNDGRQWTWTVTPNNQTNLYFVWSTTEFLEYSDGIMSWFFNYLLHRNDDLEAKYSSSSWNLPTTKDIQILTWGVAPQTSVPAGVITRVKGSLSEAVKAAAPWTSAAEPKFDRAKHIDLSREHVTVYQAR